MTSPSKSVQDHPRYSNGPSFKRPLISGRRRGPRTDPANVADDLKSTGRGWDASSIVSIGERSSSKSEVANCTLRLDCASASVP